MQIQKLPIHVLRPYARNARVHSRRQIVKIATSIRRFGFNNPILIDDDLQIIAGHGRVEAARYLDMKEVPTVRLSHLSETEKRAYILADNKLALDAGWDRETLALELQGLIDLGFEVELTGFETAEIDLALEDDAEARGREPGPEDEVPEPKGAVVSNRRRRRRRHHRLPCPALGRSQSTAAQAARPLDGTAWPWAARVKQAASARAVRQLVISPQNSRHCGVS